jgi:uncharacterized protein (TIGR03067 family)
MGSEEGTDMRKSKNSFCRISSFVVCAVLTLCQGCGSGNSENVDAKSGGGDSALVGTWVGNEVGGGSATWTFKFAVTSLEVASASGDGYKGTYTVDEASNPKRFVGTITECAYTAYVGKTSNAIYKIEGSTLTFAGNEPGSSAVPTSFERGGPTRLWELKKQ